MTSLLDKYNQALAEHDVDGASYCSIALRDKILKHFKGEVKIDKLSNKQGNVVYISTADKDEALVAAIQYASSVECKISEAALHLRSAIMALKRHTEDLPHPLTAEALAKGQAFPPEILLQFYRVLYTGSFSKNV